MFGHFTTCMKGLIHVAEFLFPTDTLREKCPNTEFFLVVFSRISPNKGKYGLEKTPHFDTFHTVIPYQEICKQYVLTSKGKLWMRSRVRFQA